MKKFYKMSCAARPVGNKAINAIAKIFIIIFTKKFVRPLH